MQQTTKYQFKLIEGSDDFSPQPLNDNVEKVEEELAILDSALSQGLEALNNALVQGLENAENDMNSNLANVMSNLGSKGKNARIAWGSYRGTGRNGSYFPNSLTFDFYPVVIFLGCENGAPGASWPGVFLRGCDIGHPDSEYGSNHLTWSEKGVSWYSPTDEVVQCNQALTYYYVVLGYDIDAEG